MYYHHHVAVMGAQHIDGLSAAVLWVRDNLNLSISDRRGIVVSGGLVFGVTLLLLFWELLPRLLVRYLKAILDTLS
jgi:hypothetical protein